MPDAWVDAWVDFNMLQEGGRLFTLHRFVSHPEAVREGWVITIGDHEGNTARAEVLPEVNKDYVRLRMVEGSFVATPSEGVES